MMHEEVTSVLITLVPPMVADRSILNTLAHYNAKRYVTLHGFQKDTLCMVQAQDRFY
jgi:hypothetical protein